MSEFLEQMVSELNGKLASASFDGSAKLEIPGEGAVVMTTDGASISDEDADVTLTADADTLKAIFEGDLNPTSAFMTGKLAVDGNMGLAMQLASVLG